MGINLFGVDIAGIVNQNISPGIPTIVLTKVTPGGRNPADRTQQLPETTEDSGGSGFFDDFTETQLASTSVRENDRLLRIIGDSLVPMVIPNSGDRVFAEGRNWTIVAIVDRDPAEATYGCHIR